MLIPIIDCAEDMLLLVSVSNSGKCINVLATTYGMLLQFMEREIITSAVYCCEN